MTRSIRESCSFLSSPLRVVQGQAVVVRECRTMLEALGFKTTEFRNSFQRGWPTELAMFCAALPGTPRWNGLAPRGHDLVHDLGDEAPIWLWAEPCILFGTVLKKPPTLDQSIKSAPINLSEYHHIIIFWHFLWIIVWILYRSPPQIYIHNEPKDANAWIATSNLIYMHIYIYTIQYI